jgi:hypothetical protein
MRSAAASPSLIPGQQQDGCMTRVPSWHRNLDAAILHGARLQPRSVAQFAVLPNTVSYTHRQLQVVVVHEQCAMVQFFSYQKTSCAIGISSSVLTSRIRCSGQSYRSRDRHACPCFRLSLLYYAMPMHKHEPTSSPTHLHGSILNLPLPGRASHARA